MAHSHDHHDHAGHNHHHSQNDGYKITAFLIFTFLVSAIAHVLFAQEKIYDWKQSSMNAESAPQSGHRP